MDETPPFAEPFAVVAVTATSITVRHRDGAWWRFDVAETNGRRLLLHAEHRPGPAPTQDPTAQALDAYDTATREARRHGMVD